MYVQSLLKVRSIPVQQRSTLEEARMKKQFSEMLKTLPPKRPRSRLEPYADLIHEMRLRDWTFREIARLLGEKCNVKVSPSNVHHFVKLSQ